MNTINQQIQEIIRQQKSLQSALDRCVKELAEKESSVSETKQQDLSKVISQAELNGLEIQDHYMVDFDDDLKNRYAFLLIALLKEVTVALSNDQYVLLKLLLQSMKLEHELGYYFEGNTEIDDLFLLDFKEKIEDKEVAQSLMVDLMIIARMNGAFDQQSLQILSELMSFFEIEESTVKEIDDWVVYILGFHSVIKLQKYTVKRKLKVQRSSFLTYMEVEDIWEGNIAVNSRIINILHKELYKKEHRVVGVRAKIAGYFVPEVKKGERLNDGEVLLGHLFNIPPYLNFWYSFINLEKVIKENK